MGTTSRRARAVTELPVPTSVRSGGQTLYVRRLGSGPRLLLLHGGPGLDPHVMLPLALPLSSSFEVWLPDLPGHGRSHDEGAGLPDLSQLLERTGRWLEALEPPPPIVAGHSLGAWIVRELLRDDRITPRAAVLISPPAAAEQPASWPPPRASPASATTGRGRERWLRKELLDFCTTDVPADPSPELVAAMVLARLRPPASYTALHGQLRRVLAGPVPACRPRCPVLIVSGDADRIGPPAAAARIAAATAGSRVELLPELGHVPFASDAEPVARTMLAFLRGCGLPDPGGAPG